MIKDNVTECFEDIEDLIANAVANVIENELETISIVATEDDMAIILKDLCAYVGFSIASIDFKYLADDYCNEYVVQFGVDKEIWCQPMIVNDEYVDISEDDLTFVLDDCNSRVLGFTSPDTIIVRLCESYDGE